MTNARGLTLLESLIAAAILAVLAGACIPLVRSISDLYEARRANLDQNIDVFALSELAHLVLTDPERFNVDLSAINTSTEIPWPDCPECEPVLVRKLRPQLEVIAASEEEQSGSSPLGGLWLVFTCGPWQTYQWLPRPPEAPPNDAPEAPPNDAPPPPNDAPEETSNGTVEVGEKGIALLNGHHQPSVPQYTRSDR